MLDIINPIEYPGWDDLIRSHPQSSFFHTSSWAKVLHESYGYRPLYFSVIENNKLLILIPIMEVNSIITGKRGVSLPFTDYCEPILEDNSSFKDLFPFLIGFGQSSKWKYIELRDSNSLFQETSISSFFYGHTLDLSEGEEYVFFNFRESTKRNIKKAIKEGVKINVCNSLASVKEFYRLNCLTRKEHGLPPQPYYFFRSIFDHVISKGYGIIVLASYGEETIAGAVFFHSYNKALYKYGASDKTYQHLRANNLVMWEAIQWYSRKRYQTLCFGRTEPENTGLMQFKSGWGTKERIINYYRYNLGNKVFVEEPSNIYGFHNIVFNKLPIPLLRLIGRLLYKHAG